MKYPSSEKSIIALETWLQTPAGGYVRAWEQAQLDSVTADMFGFNAMQVGLPEIDCLRSNRMPKKWRTDTHMLTAGQIDAGAQIAVVHDFEELPFASQSLDLVVLPHVLEFAVEPHQVLREVERVLIPEGHLIVCGFNPASMWGLRQMAGRLSSAHFLPEDGEFIALSRLKDWLKLLNMEVEHGHFGCYAPPCKSDRWLNRFSFMEKAGTRWWPYFGAVYMVHAVKRVRGMHLIGPAWTKNPRKLPKGVPATNKFQRNEHGQN